MPEAKKLDSKKSNFGHDELCKLLVKRIDTQFVAPKRKIEPSLVIGLFGEWGSGKSHLLNLIESHYKNENNKEKLTIPIAFNPWRFEKEDHLIIPLMQTTEFALKAYAKNNEKWLVKKVEDFANGIAGVVDTTSQLCAVSVIAFIRALKTNVSVPGFANVELKGESFVNTYENNAKERKDKKEKEVKHAKEKDEIFQQSSTSLYFNFHQNLQTAIGHDSKSSKVPKINLLFLIDDIDRCLPEKAVEMLESIKLFLDIEGCAFVLAVDDEVIERGIEHRYRDYIFQNNNKQQAQYQQHTAPPITGAEYLEKIIHLPFRLPLPTKQEVKAFLLEYFDEVFITKEQTGDEANNELKGKLLPPNYEETQQTKRIQRETVKTTLLDLFVNAVPRVPRKLIRVVELFQLLSDIMQERGFKGLNELTLARLVIIQLLAPDIYRFGRQRQGFFKTLEEWEIDEKVGNGKWLLDSREDKDFYPEKDNEDAKLIFERQGKRLYQLIQDNMAVRSNFNIRQLILKEHPIESSLSAYFCYLEESTGFDSSALTGQGSVVSLAVQQGKDNKPLLKLDNESEFIQFVSSSRADAWSTVAGYTGIKEGVMSESLYQDFKEALKDQMPITLESPFLAQDWLKLVVPILPKNADLLDDLTKELKTIIEHIDNQEGFDAKIHLKYGDCLAILGDPREGVGIKNNLPDINWEMVAKGDFKYGEHKETLSFGAYKISKYPITNQQFQSFVTAEDVGDERWWGGMPEDERDNFERSKSPQMNRPKTDVSWYQAVAFSRWLAHHLKQTIRLPTEQEWEKAARGPSGREYPWGGKFKAYKLNSRDGGLNETSTVGLYPTGKSEYEVYDMSGNVWEWCLNKYENFETLEVDKSDDGRVIRGGSFNDNSDFVRCAFRVRYLPSDRYYDVGFRLLCE